MVHILKQPTLLVRQLQLKFLMIQIVILNLFIFQLFVGNTDGDTAVKNSLPTPVAMKYVRIYPVSYHGNISLRVEFYGCFK